MSMDAYYGDQQVMGSYPDSVDWGGDWNNFSNWLSGLFGGSNQTANQTQGQTDNQMGGTDQYGYNTTGFQGEGAGIDNTAWQAYQASQGKSGSGTTPGSGWQMVNGQLYYNGVPVSGSGSGGGGISAYQQADLEEKKREFDATQARLQAQQAAQDQLNQSNAVQTANKDFRDYQNNHYYGSLYGMGYFAPQGNSQAYQAQEPELLKQAYSSGQYGADPWGVQPAYAGYTGQGYMNPSHPGNYQVPFGNTGTANVPIGQHVPYGPELTGESGYGGLITADGTPVAMSNYQKNMLDPTSQARYGSYAGDIAGFDPKDLMSAGQNETGNISNLSTPGKFSQAQ